MLLAALNVRNESAVIARCITAAAPIADAFVIIDTGSTDDTKAIAQATCKTIGKKLHLSDEPWHGYATNQTILLERCRQVSGDGFSFILDADEIAPESLPKLSAAVDAYRVNRVLHGEWDNRCIRIFNNARPWRYEAERHAYPALRGAKIQDLDVEVVNNRDGVQGTADKEAQRERFNRDVDHFRRLLDADPRDTRSAYYLAQSLRDAARHAEAIEAFKTRSTMGGSVDETYISRWHLGEYERINRGQIAFIVAHWWSAIKADPTRLDAYVSLAKLYNATGDHEKAANMAQVACGLDKPTGLFLTKRSDRWRRFTELAIAGRALGRGDLVAMAADGIAKENAPEAEKLYVTQCQNSAKHSRTSTLMAG